MVRRAIWCSIGAMAIAGVIVRFVVAQSTSATPAATEPAATTQPAAATQPPATQPPATQPAATRAAEATQPVAATEPSATEPVSATEPSPSTEPVNTGEFVPATQPSSIAAAPFVPAPRPFPREYQVLLTRSIFAQNGHAADVPDDPAAPSARVEDDYILRGVASQNGQMIAFVENPRKDRVFRLGKGDSVCRGKVAGVSFNGVEYEMGGAVTQVGIGYSFDGTRRQPLPATTQADADETPRRKSRRSRLGTETQPNDRATATKDSNDKR